MIESLEKKRELKIRMAAAHAQLLRALDLIDERHRCHLEKLVAQIGKIAGETELDYLRDLEQTCMKLEDFA